MDHLEVLVRQSQAGDTRAVRQLFELIVDDIHRILFRLLGPDPDHDDLCQNALVAVHRALPRFRHESSFRTWMYSICTRIAHRHVRRRRSASSLEDASLEPIGADDPECAAIVRQRMVALQGALDRMKPKKRVAYVLHDLEGLPAEEVATVMETSVATVHTRLHHARKELRRAFDKHQARETS